MPPPNASYHGPRSSNPTTASSPSAGLDPNTLPQSKKQQRRVWSSGEVIFFFLSHIPLFALESEVFHGSDPVAPPMVQSVHLPEQM